jgi:hypothetical protein
MGLIQSLVCLRPVFADLSDADLSDLLCNKNYEIDNFLLS